MDLFWEEWMDVCDDDGDANVAAMCMTAWQQHFGATRCVRGGSHPGRSRNIDRRHDMYGRLCCEDYWGPSPLYPAASFKKLFRVPIGLFKDVLDHVEVHDNYFVQKKNNAGRMGISARQKVAAAIRMLTSGVAANEFDDKYRMGESTIMESMKHFCEAINEIYGETALRVPNELDLNRLLDEGDHAGFPGCIGSIDCMHWEWKNCPRAWKGMFQGKEGVPTVVLEAIADRRGRFWHFHFGFM